jgi:hypothetical protein
MANAAITYQPQFVSQPHVASRALHRSAYVVETVVFRKTVAGQAEMVRRKGSFRPELRRLLILVDGRHTIDELMPCFRSNELPKLIDELLALGLIESVSASASFCQPSVADAMGETRSLTASQFFAARTAAVNAVCDLLGSDSRVHVLQIQACQDSRELRGAVELVVAKLRARHGDDAATIFLECIRDAACRTQH